ncbi:MAG TPA: DMT family transporter [Terriglobia bacterium]|nr:DMT family transporter [Terriglobia bacterium]
MSKRTTAELLLVLITLIWGATFVVVKGALSDASPLPFIALRFTLAGTLLLVLLARGHIERKAWVPGLTLGLSLWLGYAGQTSGLVYTTPSKSAFITGFSVILVPLLMVFWGFRLRAASLAGGAFGLAGLYLLVTPSGPSGIIRVNRGDLLVLLGSVAFAFHIVLVGVYTRRVSFLHLVPVQILTVGVLAAVAWLFSPGQVLHATGRLIVALLVTAVLATAFAFSVQNWAQQFTPPAHTALIFALEPVFAAITSRVVLGEHLGKRVLIGSGLILAGMVFSEIWGGAAPTPVEG